MAASKYIVALGDGRAFELRDVGDGRVELRYIEPSMVDEPTEWVRTVTSTAAVQLGLALCDVSRDSGQARAKRRK